MAGLIFDMDGVLVDSSEPHFHSWQQLAREIGREMSRETFKKTFGRQNRDIIPLVFDITDESKIEQLSDRKEVIYRDLIRDNVPTMDGAIELIRACHEAGFKLAIGSSGPPENVDAVLEGMGVDGLFAVKITAREVNRGKPDPQVFELATQGLGFKPNECAVVEDAPAGVEAALGAGNIAIALTGGHPVEELQPAHLVVNSLRELSPERIQSLISEAG
jgi:HAD superfamily hydrolase (TIGR01509 family)